MVYNVEMTERAKEQLDAFVRYSRFGFEKSAGRVQSAG